MNIHGVASPWNIPAPAPRRKRAFSLIEVAIALGIVGFALTTLLGLMPVGLNIFRDSIQATVQTDVLRQLTAQFQETPFDKLTNSTQMLYFSDRSTPVTSDADALFGVTCSFISNTPMLASQGGYENPSLKTAVLRFFTRADRAKSPQTASTA